MTHAALVRQPIDVSGLTSLVASHAAGAITGFMGVVRDVNEGRAVAGIEYTAYEEMAQREMEQIVHEAASRFDNVSVAVQHRLGELSLGEISVAIVVAHAHRAPALDACRYVIEELKKRVPIWKREHYADGSRAWVDDRNAPATEVVG